MRERFNVNKIEVVVAIIFLIVGILLYVLTDNFLGLGWLCCLICIVYFLSMSLSAGITTKSYKNREKLKRRSRSLVCYLLVLYRDINSCNKQNCYDWKDR